MQPTTRGAIVFGGIILGAMAIAGRIEGPGSDVMIPTDSVSADIPEDSPVWDCRTDGNKVCGSSVSYSEDGSCVYYSDGSGVCRIDGKRESIPALTEYDADFCNDIDPVGIRITLCRR